MARCSWVVRICIFANLTVSSNCGVLSKPLFLASADIPINRGRTPASCFLTWGVTFGAAALASFSNWALVMTVLQSAAGVFVAAVLAAVTGFAVPALAVLGSAEHTPLIVITAASGGTAAEVSAGAWGGAGVPGAACPQASVPNKTHISQLLPISHFLQDWSFRKLKMPSIKS